MKKKLIAPVLTIILFLLYIAFVHPAVQTITYFPLAADKQYKYAYTKLIPPVDASVDGKYRVDWTSISMSEEPLYLRQDVSLLFRNGCLIGAQSSWKKNTAAIKMTEYPAMQGDSLLEAITLHHGEIHDMQDNISSIQAMSSSRLYIDSDRKKPFTIHAFNTASTDEEADFQKRMESKTKQQLLYHWNDIASELKIDLNDYMTIPLASLAQYENEPLPGMTEKQTKETVGKLWEGLYKQYIIKVLTDRNPDTCMPLILLDRKQKHLQVIYRLNGKTEQLIQRIKH
ncbi:hypothetical protein QR721_07810 [Aciduricibacillus chroicocephali]|uniref:DUF3888 domain-containing protein n=1 Tax=Aciduricibacillus chroicocephali TaxID=3054939 RepID=A0ABY9KS35_9BACI|nr:hypothetical protein QR721_07810 [Bacillaceae bacterium 44XB]